MEKVLHTKNCEAQKKFSVLTCKFHFQKFFKFGLYPFWSVPIFTWFTELLTDRAEPDQTAPERQTDLDLHSLEQA